MILFTPFTLCLLLRASPYVTGAQRLTIDTQLGTSVEDCFDRVSIGDQLSNSAIYRNISELTTVECEKACKQDTQCQTYDYGVGAKGNATCDLSKFNETELQEKKLLLRHPDYDIYIRRFQCEQAPPKPLLAQSDDPDNGNRPIFRPHDDYRPNRYGPQPYHIPSYNDHVDDRPDDYFNNKLDYHIPTSYGDHGPQDIPPPGRPYRNQTINTKPNPNDVFHFNDPHRRPIPYPEPLNDGYDSRPEHPYIQYIPRPNRKPYHHINPQDDPYSVIPLKPPPSKPDLYGSGHPLGPIGPPDPPPRPNRPNYPYQNDQSGNYGDNNVQVIIRDPPRPPNYGHGCDHTYGPGGNGGYIKGSAEDGNSYGHSGSYSSQSLHSQSHSSQSQYYGTITEIDAKGQKVTKRPPHFGDAPQGPIYGGQGSTYGGSSQFSDQGYGSYGSQSNAGTSQSYGSENPSYNNRPDHNGGYGGSQDYGGSQSSYGSNSADQSGHGYNGAQYQSSYGQSSYGGSKGSYGSTQSSYGSSQSDHVNSHDYGGSHYQGSYGSSAYGDNQNIDNGNQGYGSGGGYGGSSGQSLYGGSQNDNGYSGNQGYGSSHSDSGNYGYGAGQSNGGSQYNGGSQPYGGFSAGNGVYGSQQSYGQAYGGNEGHYYNYYNSNDGGQFYANNQGYSFSPTDNYRPSYGNRPLYVDNQYDSGHGSQGYGSSYGNQQSYGSASQYNVTVNNTKPNVLTNQTNNRPNITGSDKPGYGSDAGGYGSNQDNRPSETGYRPPRPDYKPVYEHVSDRPNKGPHYNLKPNGQVVVSVPISISDYGGPGTRNQGPNFSYEACFRRVLAGRRALRSFVRRLITCERLEDCRYECATEKRFPCESFNYKLDPSFRGKGLCELMTKPIESFDVRRDFVEDKDYDFYEVDRNSLEPHCPVTLRGPGLLHSGFLSSKPAIEGAQYQDGWRDRLDWSENRYNENYDRYYNERKGYSGYGRGGYDDRSYVPYQLGPNGRYGEQENSDRYNGYGNSYGGYGIYYKNKNEFNKSVNYWKLNEDFNRYHGVRPYGQDSDFNYYDLGRRDEDWNQSYGRGPSNQSYGRGPWNQSYGRGTWNQSYGRGSWKSDRWDNSQGGSWNNLGYGDLSNTGRRDEIWNQRYGGGTWKKDRWEKSQEGSWKGDYGGKNYYEPGNSYYYEESGKGHYYYEPTDRSDGEDVVKDCSSRRRPGMALGSGSVRRALVTPNVVACEAACFSEQEFKCVSYSYRYSSTPIGDNCYLSERPYRGLEFTTDIGSDVYAMPQHHGCTSITFTPYVESECFWHVRSGSGVAGEAVRAALTVGGLGACEAECIRAQSFFCRGFSFRFDAPVIGDDLENCLLTSSPPTSLEIGRGLKPITGHELYARGNFGRGCEPALYDDVNHKETSCYLQYDKSARLIGAAIRGQARVKDEEACGKACTDAPFRCLSYSFSSAAPPGTENCLLSEIRLFDLQRGVDYQHSEDDWLFAFNLFNGHCWRKVHGETDDETPTKRPYLPAPAGANYPSSGPEGPVYIPDKEPPYVPGTGPSSGPPYRPGYNPSGPDIKPGYPGVSGPDYKPGYSPSGPDNRPIYPSGPDGKPGYPSANEPGYRPGYSPSGPDKPGYPGPSSPGYRPAYSPTGPDISGPGDKPGFYPSLPAPQSPPGYVPQKPGYRPNRPSYRPGDFPNRPEHIPSGPNRPEYYPSGPSGPDRRPGYLPTGSDRPQYKPSYPPQSDGSYFEHSEGSYSGGEEHYGYREDSIIMSWRHYTVSGFPCRRGTSCAQNQIAGHWACEPEGGEIGSWDYCCAPTHRCGYSEGFNKPWCYVGPSEDQWRPCSEKYYPYFQHSIPHPSLGVKGDQGYSDRRWQNQQSQPFYSRDRIRPHAGSYLSVADRRYWDELYRNGPQAYYDRNGNPLPGYVRVSSEDHSFSDYHQSYSSSGQWGPVAALHSEDPEPSVPGGLGAPRYWPVAYLHNGPPPNKMYFKYNETASTTTNENNNNRTSTTLSPNSITDSGKMSNDNKGNFMDANNQKNDMRTRSLMNEENNISTMTVMPNLDMTTNAMSLVSGLNMMNNTKLNETNAEMAKHDNRSEAKVRKPVMVISGKIDNFDSFEVFDIEDAKSGERSSNLKAIEAEEKQIEAIGRLLASKRRGRLLQDKNEQKNLQSQNIAVDRDTIDFDFGNRFPTTERKGIVQKVTKEEIEKERNNDKSLEVSETTFVRPPRILNASDNIRKTVVNGKVFYDATIREPRDVWHNRTRRLNARYLEESRAPSILSNNTGLGKKKTIKVRNVNPVRRVRRVYRKKYNPEEVRRRLLERDKNMQKVT